MGMLGFTSLVWCSRYCVFEVLTPYTFRDTLAHTYFVPALLFCLRPLFVMCCCLSRSYYIHNTMPTLELYENRLEYY